MVQGQPESRSDQKRTIGIIVVLVIIGLAVYSWFTGGQAGVQELINSFIKYAIIAAILGLIVWLVMKILQKPKTDLVENDRRAIIDAGILSKPPMVRDLYFTGDKGHSEFRVGKIIGYCQIQSYKDLDILSNLTAKELAEMERKNELPSEYILKEDCFIFKRGSFPFSLFEEPKVLRTLEHEHSELVGDVKVYAVSLIQKYGYYFPNRAFLDITRIDISVIREAWRGGIHEFLKDMVAINRRAIGLDSEFKKDLDNRKLLKIPSPLGEESTRRGE